MARKKKAGRPSNKELARREGISLEDFLKRKERKAKREEKAAEAPAEGSNVVAMKGKRGRKSKSDVAARERDERLVALLAQPIEDLVDQFCIFQAAVGAPKTVAKDDLDILRQAIREKLTAPVQTEFGSASLRRKGKSFITREKYLKLYEAGIFTDAEIELSATELAVILKAVADTRLEPEFVASVRTEESWEIVLEASDMVKNQMAEAMAQPFTKAVQSINKKRA